MDVGVPEGCSRSIGLEVSSSGGSLGGLIISLTPWMMPLYQGSSMDVGTNNFKSSGGVAPAFTGFSGSCSDTLLSSARNPGRL